MLMVDRKIRDNGCVAVWATWLETEEAARIIFDILMLNYVIRTKKSLLQQRITDLCNMRQTGYFLRC